MNGGISSYDLQNKRVNNLLKRFGDRITHPHPKREVCCCAQIGGTIAPAKAIIWRTREILFPILQYHYITVQSKTCFISVSLKREKRLDARKVSFQVLHELASQMDLNFDERVPANRRSIRLSNISKILMQTHHSEAGSLSI
jgi:hypothetical protein